jgi:hypothetical protein
LLRRYAARKGKCLIAFALIPCHFTAPYHISAGIRNNTAGLENSGKQPECEVGIIENAAGLYGQY